MSRAAACVDQMVVSVLMIHIFNPGGELDLEILSTS